VDSSHSALLSQRLTSALNIFFLCPSGSDFNKGMRIPKEDSYFSNAI